MCTCRMSLKISSGLYGFPFCRKWWEYVSADLVEHYRQDSLIIHLNSLSGYNAITLSSRMFDRHCYLIQFFVLYCAIGLDINTINIPGTARNHGNRPYIDLNVYELSIIDE